MAAKATEEKKAGQHKAGYARDKVNGGYLVRVMGPHANRFAGRTVPVSTRDGKTDQEKLTELVWAGMDDGQYSGYVGPCALYKFEPKPRDDDDEIPF